MVRWLLLALIVFAAWYGWTKHDVWRERGADELVFRNRTGQTLDVAWLTRFLGENGYGRSETVMEPGEFAMRGGLTAGEILARTRGNGAFLAVYSLFVLAVTIHAPIGLRNVAREWLGLRGRVPDAGLALFAAALAGLGLRAVFALYFS